MSGCWATPSVKAIRLLKSYSGNPDHVIMTGVVTLLIQLGDRCVIKSSHTNAWHEGR